MKVWVPIDLPEGCRVSQVLAMFDDPSGAGQWLDPLGPVRSFDEESAKPIGSAIRGGPYSPEAQRERSEPQRERWEYRIVAGAGLGDGRFVPAAGEAACNALGSEGWECFHVNPGAVWFKRRLP
jgi:hypothetical protein